MRIYGLLVTDSFPPQTRMITLKFDIDYCLSVMKCFVGSHQRQSFNWKVSDAPRPHLLGNVLNACTVFFLLFPPPPPPLPFLLLQILCSLSTDMHDKLWFPLTGYYVQWEEVSTTVSCLHTLSEKSLNYEYHCTGLSWNCTGSVIAVAFGRFDHSDWCSHKVNPKFTGNHLSCFVLLPDFQSHAVITLHLESWQEVPWQ